MDSTGKLWVALDTDKTTALRIVYQLGRAKLPVVRGVKLNRLLDEEIFRKDGEPQLLQEIADAGIPATWADLKLCDVPRSVAGRIDPYVQSGLVQYITVMAKGEVEMMMAAVEAAGDEINIIAVTELTSLTEELVHLGSGHPAKASVINLARWAVLAGVQHVVCSGQELSVIRNVKRRELRSLRPFVPGVETSFALAGSDQSRVMTVVEALKQGAEAVVIGSAIMKAPDPVEFIKRVAEEIEAAA